MGKKNSKKNTGASQPGPTEPGADAQTGSPASGTATPGAGDAPETQTGTTATTTSTPGAGAKSPGGKAKYEFAFTFNIYDGRGAHAGSRIVKARSNDETEAFGIAIEELKKKIKEGETYRYSQQFTRKDL